MKTTAIKRFATCLVALMAAVVMMLALSACAPKEITVTVNDNGATSEVTTEEGKTVSEILEANDITLDEGDEVDPSLDTQIEGENATITISRMHAVVVAADGENVDVSLLGGTVQDALDKAEVKLAEGDTVDIDVATALEDGMLITVTRAKKEEPKTTSNNSNASSNSNKSSSNASANASSNKPAERTVVSRTKVPNCDDGSHGYEEITYSDGTVEYREY